MALETLLCVAIVLPLWLPSPRPAYHSSDMTGEQDLCLHTCRSPCLEPSPTAASPTDTQPLLVFRSALCGLFKEDATAALSHSRDFSLLCSRASSSVPGANASPLEDPTHPKSKALSVGVPQHGSDDNSVSQDVFSSPFQAKAQQGWLVVGTVGCPGPEISQSFKVPITSCQEFIWDRPTLLVLGR